MCVLILPSVVRAGIKAIDYNNMVLGIFYKIAGNIVIVIMENIEYQLLF